MRTINQFDINTDTKMQAIISAAMALFAQKGFTRATIDDIAALARVSKASIYNYFGGKEALVAECAHIVMASTFAKAGAILEKDIPFIEKIEQALRLCTENINLSLSASFAGPALRDAPFVRLLAESVNTGKRAIFRAYVESGKHDGVIDSAIPTETVLDYIAALDAMSAGLEKAADPAVHAAHIHHLFLYGILGKAK